jgi:hypothetical protein
LYRPTGHALRVLAAWQAAEHAFVNYPQVQKG